VFCEPAGMPGLTEQFRAKFNRRLHRMSIFEHRKPVHELQHRSSLEILRETLKRLEDEPVETERTADLKRILAKHIAELERKTA
jgi:hypothetical protein